MSIYAFIGILRCPYRDECGPDAGWGLDYEDDRGDAERFCFTRRHYKCDIYKSKINATLGPKSLTENSVPE
jgi:hypothetical protein